MADDIVERLREEIDSLKVDVQVLRDAADEIEWLRIENRNLIDEADWLRRQLRAAVLIITHYNDDPDAMEGVYVNIIKETK